MDFVTPLSPPMSISASELDLEPLGDWDFERDYLDCIMSKAVELEQGRREQQRQRMVIYRRKKKDIMTSLHQERQRLEEILGERIARMRIVDTITIKTTRSKEEAVHQVVLEHAQLARENFVLRRSVDECGNHRKIIEQAYLEFGRHLQDDPLPSDNIPLSRDEGWYVHFPDNSPSFYFQPLSQKEFDNGRDLHVDTSPCFSTVGNIFGWTVDYAPITRNQSDTAFMAYARFSRRIRCNLDDAASILLSTDPNSWPVVVSARSWGLEQRGRHRYVVLQQLDDSSHVAVCNIPGDINLRYIAATRHSREKRSDGKRVDTCSVSIIDSKKNALLREMEGQQQNVQWIQEGACIATFTEVDDTTIDVVCDHWAGCLSDAHGHELYVDWIQHTVGLEQTISPSRLLRN